MSQNVSMSDIARRLDVSRATVSYVLNGRDSVLISAATRERVLATAREMGYRPNRAAQALAGRPSHLVELFVRGYYPAFYARALHEFGQLFDPTPYQLHIVDPRHWIEENWEKAGGGWPVDGVIIFDANLPDKVMTAIQERGMPVVSAGVAPHTTMDYVHVDWSSALEAAVRHLTARGDRIAFVSPWPTPWEMNIDPRYATYRAIMQEANLSEEVIVIPDRSGLGTRTLAREIVRDYVTKNGCPDGIFCFNDERAIATLAALRDLKLRVPNDVLLIGCDDIEEAIYQVPPLSTIQYPYSEVARLAWEFLSRRMAQPDIPLQSATLTAPLVLRESSAR